MKVLRDPLHSALILSDCFGVLLVRLGVHPATPQHVYIPTTLTTTEASPHFAHWFLTVCPDD